LELPTPGKLFDYAAKSIKEQLRNLRKSGTCRHPPVEIARRAFHCLVSKGIFAFDLFKHVDNSNDTRKSSIAKRLKPYTFGMIRNWFDAKLMRFTMNETEAAHILERTGFATWSFERIQGRVGTTC
jgi:hypothetical protein